MNRKARHREEERVLSGKFECTILKVGFKIESISGFTVDLQIAR